MERLFAFSNLVPRKIKELWQAFWHGTIWFIWKARNRVIFKGDDIALFEVVEQIKFNVWSWLRCKGGILLSYKYVDWEINPKGVLNLL